MKKLMLVLVALFCLVGGFAMAEDLTFEIVVQTTAPVEVEITWYEMWTNEQQPAPIGVERYTVNKPQHHSIHFTLPENQSMAVYAQANEYLDQPYVITISFWDSKEWRETATVSNQATLLMLKNPRREDIPRVNKLEEKEPEPEKKYI